MIIQACFRRKFSELFRSIFRKNFQSSTNYFWDTISELFRQNFRLFRPIFRRNFRQNSIIIQIYFQRKFSNPLRWIFRQNFHSSTNHFPDKSTKLFRPNFRLFRPLFRQNSIIIQICFRRKFLEYYKNTIENHMGATEAVP